VAAKNAGNATVERPHKMPAQCLFTKPNVTCSTCARRVRQPSRKRAAFAVVLPELVWK